jgi:hypothetical protein
MRVRSGRTEPCEQLCRAAELCISDLWVMTGPVRLAIRRGSRGGAAALGRRRRSCVGARGRKTRSFVMWDPFGAWVTLARRGFGGHPTARFDNFRDDEHQGLRRTAPHDCVLRGLRQIDHAARDVRLSLRNDRRSALVDLTRAIVPTALALRLRPAYSSTLGQRTLTIRVLRIELSFPVVVGPAGSLGMHLRSRRSRTAGAAGTIMVLSGSRHTTGWVRNPLFLNAR